MSHFLDRLTWFRREQDTFSEGHGTSNLFEVSHILEARSWSVATVRYVAALAATAEIDGVSIDPASLPGGG